jgi:hypothetical protein
MMRPATAVVASNEPCGAVGRSRFEARLCIGCISRKRNETDNVSLDCFT